VIEDLWYKNAIIYSLDLESFMDGDGDGTGDLVGLVRRLDYLETLGVDVVWLAPFHPSPMRDNGYDVADFYGVASVYGSPGTFVEFVHQAQKRGIRVLMDLVVNHTSSEHPWFVQARGDRDSRYRDWYLWSEKRPRSWNQGMIFPGVQHRTWTRDAASGQWYFHRFYDHQPNLNLGNPEVRTELRRIIGYWLQQGVHGFRLDALPFLLSSPPDKDGRVTPGERFEYLEELRTFVQWRQGDAVLLGEANLLPDQMGPYFQSGRGVHMLFNFWVNQHLFLALARREVAPLVQALEDTRALPPTAQWAHFLRNHDELDLAQLEDDERAEVFAAFAPQKRMQIYDRGIRRRLHPMMGNEARHRLAYSLLFSLPGTPVLRYGDEIGMGENLALKERRAVRTPMQWSDEPAAGFSTAEKLIHPVIDKGPYGHHHVNVEKQRRRLDTFLQWMGRMIRLRKECPEVGWGRFSVIDTGSPHVLALLFEWRGSAVFTLHNLEARRLEIAFTLGCEGGGRLYNLMDHEALEADAKGRHQVALEGHGYRWYRVGTLNYALARAPEAPEQSRPSQRQRGRASKQR
jgi:maltose alpha-D-glucosyltransferase/alpha-amylase